MATTNSRRAYAQHGVHQYLAGIKPDGAGARQHYPCRVEGRGQAGPEEGGPGGPVRGHVEAVTPNSGGRAWSGRLPSRGFWSTGPGPFCGAAWQWIASFPIRFGPEFSGDWGRL